MSAISRRSLVWGFACFALLFPSFAAAQNQDKKPTDKGISGSQLFSGSKIKVELAQTQIFGVKAEGTKFLYVFDRSSSMEVPKGRPMAAAKAELLASLKDLKSTHQFQVIFYNHLLSVCDAGTGPRMLWGDERGKSTAQEFVTRMKGDGGTKHLPALITALRLQPDVIFFLTDADDPILSLEELERVRDSNHGTAIHCIEFGSGPQKPGENFMQRLARENGGKHAYVDTRKLGAP